MTALPLPQPPQPPWPDHALAVAEYAALGEEEHGRYELQEGSVLVSPSPVPDHMLVMARLVVQLAGQLPAHVEVLPDVDVDLELVAPGQPGWVRRPDLVVVELAAIERVRHDGGLLRAADVLVVVEIVSPGSHRTDHVIKHGEYADAGIRHYWIVDLDPPVSLIDCQLAEGFGYRDAGAVAGTFGTTEPFPLELRLDNLL